MDDVRCSSWAHWQARSGLPISGVLKGVFKSEVIGQDHSEMKMHFSGRHTAVRRSVGRRAEASQSTVGRQGLLLNFCSLLSFSHYTPYYQGWARDVKARDRDETETLASPAETRR